MLRIPCVSDGCSKVLRSANGKLFERKLFGRELFGQVGRVAQLVEQCPFKAWVAGSSPAALTRYSIRFFPFCGTGGRQTYLRHGVILTAAVFQAEGRACPERGRRDIAPHWQCVREAPMRRSLNPSEPWALTHLCIYTAETLWSRWWLFLTISVAPGYVGSGSV